LSNVTVSPSMIRTGSGATLAVVPAWVIFTVFVAARAGEASRINSPSAETTATIRDTAGIVAHRIGG